MIIKITNFCPNYCKNCSDKSKDSFMSIEVFSDVLDFLEKNNIGRYIEIDGGDALSHPQFYSFLSLILQNYTKRFGRAFRININTYSNELTNSENIDILSDLVECFPSLYFNISNEITIEKDSRLNKNVMYGSCHQLYLKNIMKNPHCTNYRLVEKQINNSNIKCIDSYLSICNNYIVPLIDMNGNIKLGDNNCPSVGTIYDDISLIENNIHNFKCKQCISNYLNMTPIVKNILFN